MTAGLSLLTLDARLKILLPTEYQDRYENVQPVSMGSAGLKYGPDGKVAWDEMWATFCDLAMAGGPPHKGRLLEPGSPAEIEAQPQQYREVTEEICRGLSLVTALHPRPSSRPGWIRLDCGRPSDAAWLVRAIVMENVSAGCEGAALFLPSGPAYRVEKEIKNVITATAKTCHYYFDHMWAGQHRAIARLFEELDAEWALIQPALADSTPPAGMQEAIRQATGFPPSERCYRGWFGVDCASIRAAIWIMRALAASNVLSRREETILFLPVNPDSDPGGEIVVRCLTELHRLAKQRQIL